MEYCPVTSVFEDKILVLKPEMSLLSKSDGFTTGVPFSFFILGRFGIPTTKRSRTILSVRHGCHDVILDADNLVDLYIGGQLTRSRRYTYVRHMPAWPQCVQQLNKLYHLQFSDLAE